MIKALQGYFSINTNHILEILNIIVGNCYLLVKSNGLFIVDVKDQNKFNPLDN
jgi:hypothetical protein